MSRHFFRSNEVVRRVLDSRGELSGRAITTSSQAASMSSSAPGPILTFLSSSPKYSRSAVEFFNELFDLPRIDTESISTNVRRDSLDELHFGSSSSSWDSMACACPTSGTVLHFLSYSDDQYEEANNSEHPASLHLMAVHGSHSSSLPSTSSSQTSKETYLRALTECRQRLAGTIQERQLFSHSGDKNGLASASSNLEARVRGLLFYVMCSGMGRQPNPSWILEKNPSTTRSISPLMDLTPLSSNLASLKHSNEDTSPIIRSESLSEKHDHAGKLRELAMPFFPGVSSLQTKLSKSSLSRPLPGLYQCSVGSKGTKSATKRNVTNDPGLIFRPLPAAQEDLRLSPPSLVFQCESLEGAQKLVEGKLGGRIEKIGWRGHGQSGSLIVTHPSIIGLDIRICEAPGNEWKLEGMFAEAQESLLAGSLEELQSTHVVSEGKGDNTSTVKRDTKTLNADCWVEFRSNIKHPLGFFKQLTSSLFQKPARTKVAKPPDIPYE